MGPNEQVDCTHAEVEYEDGPWGDPEAVVVCMDCGATLRNGDR